MRIAGWPRALSVWIPQLSGLLFFFCSPDNSVLLCLLVEMRGRKDQIGLLEIKHSLSNSSQLRVPVSMMPVYFRKH